MSSAKPIYTTVESVKVRLANKVQFQSGAEPLQGELPNALLCQLIADAETEVEQDLRSRYLIPFQSATTGRFIDLPDHSMRALRIPCDLKSVLKILATDFGSGTHVSADPYAKALEKEYKNVITRLLGRDMEGANDKIDRFRRSPPLDDVALALSNSAQADNGFRGRLINTDATCDDSATYAGRQINDPSKSYIRKRGWGGL
jgi:hypothetical protein